MESRKNKSALNKKLLILAGMLAQASAYAGPVCSQFDLTSKSGNVTYYAFVIASDEQGHSQALNQKVFAFDSQTQRDAAVNQCWIAVGAGGNDCTWLRADTHYEKEWQEGHVVASSKLGWEKGGTIFSKKFPSFDACYAAHGFEALKNADGAVARKLSSRSQDVAGTSTHPNRDPDMRY